MSIGSLFISRTWLPTEQAAARSHMDDFNRSMPDITLRWRDVGKCGVMLIQSGEYQDLMRYTGSRLARQAPATVKADLNRTFLKDSSRITVITVTTDYANIRGASDIHVGFVLDDVVLKEERAKLVEELNRRNKVTGEWQHAFRPFVSIATIPRVVASEAVLEALSAIQPENLTLYGAKATVG